MLVLRPRIIRKIEDEDEHERRGRIGSSTLAYPLVRLPSLHSSRDYYLISPAWQLVRALLRFGTCMAHDVFISHSNQDRMVVSAMCSRLEQGGIRCWIAPRDVRPGRNWGSEIIRGLDNAKVMIVVLSANANTSRPVMKEVERAFDKGIVIIPVRTGGSGAL